MDEHQEIVRDVPAGLESGLPNYWYPVLQSEELNYDEPLAFRVLSRDLVAWRDPNGEPHTVVDRCPHRGARLSIGHVLDGGLQCPLHGIRFGGDGGCVRIPWESDDSELLGTIAVPSFPTRELGGYIWAYLGDAEKHPPPRLEDEVPAELSAPDEFIWFRMPTDYWKTNWLVAIDGGDAYHAVMLHSGSQVIEDDPERRPGDAKKPVAPLAERRVKIVQTAHGIRGIAVDGDGDQIQHGHLTNQKLLGDRFILPCMSSNPIRPAPGAAMYTSRLWQYPVDEHLTRIERFICFRAEDADERERATQVFHDIARPRVENVGAEDKMVAESQGDLVTARGNEILFAPDADTVKIRQTIRDAFLATHRNKRTDIPAAALVFPV